MMIDEQNKKGGLLGRKLEAVVVDPASDWPLFAEKARELLEKDKVAVVFGCWTSVSRKSVLPVFEKNNGLLFYPVQYEGEESSKNVIYTGAAPNQQAIPAVDYLMKEVGVKRWVLEGTDYVYPRTTNRILEAYLKSKGVAAADISINYTPFGHSDWQTRVAAIKRFGSAGKKTAVVSTINGDANVPFYKELGNQKISAEDIPVVAFSVGEEELSGLDTKPLVGHLAAWNYFQSISSAGQRGVHQAVEDLHQEGRPHDQRPDGSALHRLQPVGEGGGEGEVGRRREGARGAARPRDAEPDRRHRPDAAEPPHHQAGLHRRGARRRPVRRGLEDERHGAGRRVVRLPARSARTPRPTGSRSSAATTTRRRRCAPDRTTSERSAVGRAGGGSWLLLASFLLAAPLAAQTPDDGFDRAAGRSCATPASSTRKRSPNVARHAAIRARAAGADRAARRPPLRPSAGRRRRARRRPRTKACPRWS